MTPERLNAWIRLGLAPIVGIGLAIGLTVTQSWQPWALPIVGGLIFGPLVWTRGPDPPPEEIERRKR